MQPRSQRTTCDLSQIIDFCAPEKKEEIGFGDEPDNNFDKHLLDFSPTTNAAYDPELTFPLQSESEDEMSNT